jgi:membrane-associated protease RseP (regulator of RpoE activity)
VPPTEPEIHIIGPDGVPIGVVRRPPPRPRRIWLHIVLFLLTTLFATLYGGVQFGERGSSLLPQLWWGLIIPPAVAWRLLTSPAMLIEGLTFSLPLMTILLSHETGHYLACRAHRLDATLPYFLPVPFGIGTLGAFIRIRAPFMSKRELMDVGAAGPLAGFVVTLPFLLAGLAVSTPTNVTPPPGTPMFGEPLAFHALGRLLHPSLLHGGDIVVQPMAMAAWFGLLVTALNLLPFGQLDGGHVTYALLGKVHRRLAWPLLLLLICLGLLWPGWWLWVVIALAMGVRHPWLPDQDAPLDRRRRLLGWACIALFVLCFTPSPVSIVP